MKRTLLTLIGSAASLALFAWGQNGHRITAQVCDLNLTPAAKAAVQDLLGKDYLAEIATWPDFIRSEKDWDFAKNWHFTTIDPGTSVADVIAENAENDKIDDVIEAIELMIDILEGDPIATQLFEDLMEENEVTPLKNSTQATALAFLIHFIGDVHQPMHVGKNNDFGGNKISVLFFEDQTNLHSVWDSGMIDQEKLSFTEFAKFINKLSDEEMATLQADPIAAWAEESVLAREDIYNTLYDTTDRDTGLPSFSYQYQHDFIPVIRERLLAGGVRAAGVLNAIFN